jgi:hypothetical protein
VGGFLPRQFITPVYHQFSNFERKRFLRTPVLLYSEGEQEMRWCDIRGGFAHSHSGSAEKIGSTRRNPNFQGDGILTPSSPLYVVERGRRVEEGVKLPSRNPGSHLKIVISKVQKPTSAK